MTRYIYELGSDSFEGSPRVYVTHEASFSQAEFEALLKSALHSLIQAWLDADIGHDNRLLPWSKVDRFEYLVTDTLGAWLCAHYGFESLRIQASMVFNGWAGITDQDSWPRSDYTTNTTLCNYLDETGLTPLIENKNAEYDAYFESLSSGIDELSVEDVEPS